MSPLSTPYLFAYNSLQAIGWAFALSRILSSFVITKSVNGAYDSAGELICLVPSGVVNPLLQWGGRTHFLLAVVRQIDEVQELPSVFITFVAWSSSEVIRYSHYALNCMGSCPYWINYLRYTAFIVLYPIGMAPGEMWLMYQALPFIKKKHLHEHLFNGLPFSYYNFLRVKLDIQFLDHNDYTPGCQFFPGT
uniref:Very-long-chain (3R)-3-hydroxyacyl-CoA dehydratase n=1 Tax=Fagus sylvatica TaxID=28930 RepID=A0A2N9IBA8_FAGSY